METPYAHIMARIIRPADRVVGRLRSVAVARLQLKTGASVVDAGCGVGSSFSYLLKAVGPSGRVVGVEIDPFLADKAQALVRRNGWSNVQVIQADAQSVTLPQSFDGMLMFAAHEVSTSPSALDNLFKCLGERASVVAFGAKQSRSLLGRAVNPLLRLASKRWLPFSAPIDTAPWTLLQARLAHIHIEEYLLGILYLASGSPTATPRDAHAQYALGLPAGA